jgi:(2Fe-2S) ferredoxin
VHPQNLWYGKVDTDAVDEILDALEEGGVAEDYLISE